MQRTTRNLARLATVGAMLAGTFASVQAADLPVYKKAPPPVEAFNPWMVRLRVLGVLPDGGGSTVNAAGVPSLSSPNSGLSISDQVVPELDISYFFTKNIAAELDPRRDLGTRSAAPARSRTRRSARPRCCRRRRRRNITSIGYPLMLKATAGGGGRGIRRSSTSEPNWPTPTSAPARRRCARSAAASSSWSAWSPAPATSRCR